MRKYLFDKALRVGDELNIEGDLFKHIFKVCRHKKGDQFELLSKEGASAVKVITVDKKSANVCVFQNRKITKIKKPYIHLVLANPRPAVFESVVEKAVELGVKSIYPVISQNSFLKSIQKLKNKEERVQKIINQAMQQSGRVESLLLHESMGLSDFASKFKKEKTLSTSTAGFLLYEKSQSEVYSKSNEQDKLRESESAKSKSLVQDIFIVVGAEGGFSKEEADLLMSSGFSCLHLGEQILRVETACVAGISILKSIFEVW